LTAAQHSEKAASPSIRKNPPSRKIRFPEKSAFQKNPLSRRNAKGISSKEFPSETLL